MEGLKRAWKGIDGFKLYITAIATATYAILGFALSLHDAQKTVELLLVAAGMVGFKSALAKLEVRKK